MVYIVCPWNLHITVIELEPPDTFLYLTIAKWKSRSNDNRDSNLIDGKQFAGI